MAKHLMRRDIRWLVWFPAGMYLVALPVGAVDAAGPFCQHCLGAQQRLCVRNICHQWRTLGTVLRPRSRINASYNLKMQ